jgi:hypothetical protein
VVWVRIALAAVASRVEEQRGRDFGEIGRTGCGSGGAGLAQRIEKIFRN